MALLHERVTQFSQDKIRKETEVHELSKKLIDLKAVQEEEQRSSSGLDSKANSLKFEIKDLEQRISRVQTDIVGEESVIYSKNQSLEDLTRKIETKVQRLADCKSRLLTMEAERAKKHVKNTELDQEIEEMITSMKAKEIQLQNVRNEQLQRTKKKDYLDQSMREIALDIKSCMQDLSELDKKSVLQNGKLESIAEETYTLDEETEKSIKNNVKVIREKSLLLISRVNQNIDRLQEVQHHQTGRLPTSPLEVSEVSPREHELDKDWDYALDRLDRAVKSQSISQSVLVDSFRKIISGIKLIEDKVLEAENRQVQFGDIVTKRSISFTSDIEKLDRILQTEKTLTKTVERLKEQIREDDTTQKVIQERIASSSEHLSALERNIKELTEYLQKPNSLSNTSASKVDISRNLSSSISSLSRQVSSTLEWLKSKKDSSSKVVVV